MIAWDTIRGPITERMRELDSYIDQDVNRKIRGMCEMFRTDAGNQFTWVKERQRKLEQWMESVVNAAEDRLGENNHRNNNQERMLEQISVTLMGLSGKMEHRRKDTQKIHEKQTQAEKRMEEENKNLSGEMEKSIDSVTQQEEKMFDEGRYDPTMVPHVSNVG